MIKPAYSVSFLLSINIFVWKNVLYFPNDPHTYIRMYMYIHTYIHTHTHTCTCSFTDPSFAKVGLNVGICHEKELNCNKQSHQINILQIT